MKRVTQKTLMLYFHCDPYKKSMSEAFSPVSIIVFIVGIYNSNHSNNNDDHNNNDNSNNHNICSKNNNSDNSKNSNICHNSIDNINH